MLVDYTSIRQKCWFLFSISPILPNKGLPHNAFISKVYCGKTDVSIIICEV